MIRRFIKSDYREIHIRNTHDLNLRVVWIGGGGGAAAVLRALWKISPKIVAVICVTDDGADSGKLRQGLGWAPGDVRRALVALAAAQKSELAQMLGVRFDERFPERAGQSLGNSVFAAAALCNLDVAGQIQAVAHLLEVTGTVYPATYDSVRLVGEMKNGSIILGESAVAACGSALCRVRLDPEDALPPSGAKEDIHRADAIVVGPGSVATSLIPAMMPSAAAIAETDAARFLLIPAFNEGGFDHGYNAADYVRFIAGHFPDRRMFDCVLCHQHPAGTGHAGTPAGCAGQRPVAADLDAIRALGYAAVGADLLGPDGRHEGERVAALVSSLCRQFSRQCPPAIRVRQEQTKNVRYA